MNERRLTHLLDEGTRFDPDDGAATALIVDLLGDGRTWLEPRPALEDGVVGALGTARVRRRRARRLLQRAVAAATAVAAACALVVGLRAREDPAARFTGHLSASGSLSGATGATEIYASRSGFRVALDADGLPALPGGRYYEAWLADANGTELPVGTFSSSRGEITLWAGLSSADFSRMTVTLESVDNDQAPSADVVLAGELHRA